MAATTRVRTNNVFGTTTDAPLLVGATTMNGAGLANLPVIASPNVSIITLDPNRVNGAPEIVRVTAHTGSATSATITRGAEGTAAREHPVGTFWVHAPTTFDHGTDWAPYTPTNTNITVGNGTQTVRFERRGNTVRINWNLVWGSTTAFTGTPAVGLPTTAAQDAVGSLWLFDNSSGAQQSGICRLSTSTALALLGNTATITATAPWTWATGDVLRLSFAYEAV